MYKSVGLFMYLYDWTAKETNRKSTVESLSMCVFAL